MKPAIYRSPTKLIGFIYYEVLSQIINFSHQVTKRDEDSSLMQLKEEFRTYEALRREHDSQIVQIAMEAGLRIAPDQWSSLLYGDQSHKSHMQSIIDKVKHLHIVSFLFLYALNAGIICRNGSRVLLAVVVGVILTSF